MHITEYSIKEVLMKRDGNTEEEANERIKEAREELMEYIACGDMDLAQEICYDHFGLEPDYLFELM